MKVTIEIKESEVKQIIAEHVRKNVLYHYAVGKVVDVHSDSYHSLNVKVDITDAVPANEDKSGVAE